MEQESIFKLHAPYQPTGDQPDAIATLTDGVMQGYREANHAGCDWQWQNVYNDEYYCKLKPPHAGASTQ